MSPTSRTLKKLREMGYQAEVVEKWIPGANIRRDLFGLLDIVALREGETLGVQCTSRSNISARVKKFSDSQSVGNLRRSGWTLQVWGWSKVKGHWAEKVVDLS